MHRVLIIESDQAAGTDLQKELDKYSDQFEVSFASDIEDAVRLLGKESISVVVAQLIMPDVNELDLLSFMERNYPLIHCIVVIPPGYDDLKKISRNTDTMHFLEKPVDKNMMIGKIMEAIEKFDEGGTFAKVSVASLLQLVEFEDKTCLLKVHHSKHGNGRFYFIRGELWNADCNDVSGEEAALTMIGWEHVDFKFDKLPQEETARKINKELMYLLMEGKRRKDEMDEALLETTSLQGEEDETGSAETRMEELQTALDDAFEIDEEAIEHSPAPLKDETEQKLQSLFDDDLVEETDDETQKQDEYVLQNQPEERPNVPSMHLQDTDLKASIQADKASLPDEAAIINPHPAAAGNDFLETEEDRHIKKCIMLAEGHHLQEARSALAVFLKRWPKSYTGWLWYSRVSGNLKAVESALKNAAIFAPGEPEVNEDIKKLVLAKNSLKSELVQRCPFCWSPVEKSAALCPYCKSHLFLHEKFFSSFRSADQKIVEKAIRRYENVLNQGNNASVSYYLGLAYLNLEDWEQGLEHLMTACQVAPENSHFALQQKSLMTFMASIETMPHNEVYTRNPLTEIDEGHGKKAGKKKILVVEDSAVTRKVISMALNQTGYEVAETKNGSEALAYVEEQRPDLILLDIVMPGMDGYQVLTVMKQKNWMKDIPVIMLTARGKLIDKLKGKMAGTTEYLTKPFEPEELIKTVGKYL